MDQNVKEQRMQRAVEICASLFLKNGIETVKMTDIADMSGIGVATLYRHYNSKTGIAIAAMTYLWDELRAMYSHVFESEVFLGQSGIKQIADLMRMYIVLYENNKDFMKLLGEFDLYLIREKVPKEELVDYERSIINFYPVFAASYRTGIADGTIRRDVDIKLFYLTYAHTLMELCKKMIQGDILPSDDFSQGEIEIGLLIDTAVSYLLNDI